MVAYQKILYYYAFMQRIIFRILLLSLCFHLGVASLNAEEQVIILLRNEVVAQLKPYLGQPVLVRGFIYKSEQDQWYLSAEPALRSCCIGTGIKAQNQILLRGFHSNDLSSGVVAQVKGVLKNAGTGEEYSLLLDQASWLPQASYAGDLWWLLAAISLVISIFYLWRRCWR